MTRRLFMQCIVLLAPALNACEASRDDVAGDTAAILDPLSSIPIIDPASGALIIDPAL